MKQKNAFSSSENIGYAIPGYLQQQALMQINYFWRSWIGATHFGGRNRFMYDCPTHFRHEPIRLLTKVPICLLDSTLPYCPWSNGAIE